MLRLDKSPGARGLPVPAGLFQPTRAMDSPVIRSWVDLQDTSRPWRPGTRWSASSTIYVKVVSVEVDTMQAETLIVDPCFPRSLGEAFGKRTLIDTGSKLMLQGNHVDKLCVSSFYVLYGTLAPVQHEDGAYHLAVPRCCARAGVSRLLGARLPWEPPVEEGTKQRIAVAELFCGGVGGWSQACRCCDDFQVVMALDSDPVATKWFVNNNGGCHCIHGDFLAVDMHCADFPVYTCDVADKSWYQTFLELGCDMFTISFPCTPWSAMGSQMGLQSGPGQALLEALNAAKILQPLILTFENVPGFRASSEYTAFVDQLQLAGFQIMYAAMDDLASYTCSSRRRWIAVAMNSLHLSVPQRIHSWARPPFKCPVVFDPKKHLADFDDPEQLRLWEPSSHELEILQQYPVPDISQCPASRIIPPGSTLPTYTASYRKSLTFASGFLKSKGLHAWLVKDTHQRLRWLSASEAAVNMGFPLDIQLPADLKQAVHLVGNAIAVPHAALGLHYVARTLNEQVGANFSTDFGTILATMGCQSVDLSELVIVVQEETMLLCQKHSWAPKRQRTHLPKPTRAPHLALPSLHCHRQDAPNDGLQQLCPSRTLSTATLLVMHLLGFTMLRGSLWL